MPRYVFDIHDGLEAHGPIGAEMADIKEARREAMQIARAHAGRPEMLDADGSAISVTVRSDKDEHVLTVRLMLSVEAG